MTNEQIRLMAYLYLIGIVINLIWIICEAGGIIGLINHLREVAKDVDVEVPIGLVIIIAIPVILLFAAAWPITMHIGISKGANK